MSTPPVALPLSARKVLTETEHKSYSELKKLIEQGVKDGFAKTYIEMFSLLFNETFNFDADFSLKDSELQKILSLRARKRQIGVPNFIEWVPPSTGEQTLWELAIEESGSNGHNLVKLFLAAGVSIQQKHFSLAEELPYTKALMKICDIVDKNENHKNIFSQFFLSALFDKETDVKDESCNHNYAMMLLCVEGGLVNPSDVADLMRRKLMKGCSSDSKEFKEFCENMLIQFIVRPPRKLKDETQRIRLPVNNNVNAVTTVNEPATPVIGASMLPSGGPTRPSSTTNNTVVSKPSGARGLPHRKV